MAIYIEQLRRLVQDPAGTSQILEDSAYNEIIDLEVNAYRAAAVICRMIAATFAGKMKVKAGPVTVDLQQKYRHYMDLADSFDQQAREGGGGDGAGSLGVGAGAPALTGVSESEMQTQREDTDRYPSSFERGIHDYDKSQENTEEYD